MRNYKQDHARRQKAKHRIAFEIDRTEYETLTDEQRKTIKMKIREFIKQIIKEIKF